MLEELRLKIGLWYARVRFSARSEPIIHFTQAISRTRCALVVLPESTYDASSVDAVVRFLEKRLQVSKIVLVVRREFMVLLPERRGFEVLAYSSHDLTPWFVPRSELRRKLKKSTFDMALDLNLEFALPSAFLCRESQAPVRVGFTKAHADHFYNFQIHTSQNKDLTQAHRNLLKCIDMF